jgi:hypothetical protein
MKKSIKILHVDDDPGFLKVAKQCLEMQGEFQVEIASSVEEAIERIKKEAFAAIVSDFVMPRKDGLEFLQELRTKDSRTPFFIFTGKGREEIAVKALNLGADGYFSKHGEPETVYGELAHGIRLVVERKTVEMKICEREERLRAIFGSSPDAIIVSDLHGNILDCSEAAWKMFGFSSKEEVIGRSSFDFIAEKDRQKAYENLKKTLEENLKKTLEQGTTRNLEYTLLNKDGDEFWGELSASILKDSLGNPSGFVGIIRDITARKKTEKTLSKAMRESNGFRKSGIEVVGSFPWGTHLCQFYKTKDDLLETLVPYFAEGLRNNEYCMWVTSEPLGTEGAKEAMRKAVPDFDRCLERGQIEILPHTKWYLEHGVFNSKRVLDGWISRLNEALAKGYDGLRLTGNTFWLEKENWNDFVNYEKAVNSVIEQYKMIAICTYSLDKCQASEVIDVVSNHQFALIRKSGEWKIITSAEFKNAREEARRSDEILRDVFACSPDAILIIDLNGNIVDCNEAALRLMGYSSKEEIVGRNHLELIAEKDRESALKCLKMTVDQGIAKSVEHTFLKKNGEEYLGELSTSILRDSIGNPVCFVGVIRDRTERKGSEAEVKRLASFPEENPNPVLEIDLTGKTTYLNPAARKMLSQLHDSKLSDGFEEDLKAIIGEFNTHRTGHFMRENVKIADRYYQQSIYYLPENPALRIYMVDITERSRTEKILRESEEKYRRLVEQLQEGVWAIDKDSCTTFVNSRMAEILGYTVDEMLGKPLFAFMDKRGIEIAKRLLEGRAQGIREQHDFEFVKKDGSRIYATLETSPINDSDGSYIGALAGVMDITERRKTEKTLQESEESFRAIFEGAGDGIIGADVKTKRFFFANPRICEITGYSLEELLKLGVGDLHAKKDLPYVIDSFTKQMQGKLTLSKDIPVLRKDERVVYCDVNSKPVKIGSREYLVGFFRDVSERKNAEDKLRESEEKYRSLVELAPDGIMAVNAEGIITSANRSFLTLVGYDSEEEIIGKPFMELKSSRVEDIPRMQELFMSLMKGESRLPVEFLYARRDGTSRWAEVHPSLLVKDGNPVGAQVIMRDVTERKKIETVLRDSEEQLSILFELAPDAYYLNDLKGNFVDGNKAAEEVTGYTKNELIGKSFLKLKLLPRNQALKAAKLLAMNAFGKPTGPDEFVLNRKDGTQIPVEIRTYPVKIKDKTLVLGIARDITIRKKNEQAAKESQQKFEGLFKHNPEATVYLDSEFRILDASPRFCQLFGYSAKEIEGKHIDEIVALEDMMEEAERLNKNAKKGYAGNDTVRKRKDGSLVQVSVSAAPVTIEGKLLGYVGVYKDITNLKDTEKRLKEMNKKLEVTNEKLHVIGGLTRHDVRNKLTAVAGNAYLLKRRLSGDAKALGQLNEMEAAVRLVEEIFEFARIYEKLGVEQLARMDVGKAVDGAVSLFSGLKGVKMVNECRGLTVLADSLLSQLFYNLIDNSLKHGEKTQQIRVYYKTSSSNQLELVYEDDGVGIPDNMRSNLFKEGFTSGKGTGYGLFMIKRICEVYDWTIRETGKQGKGVKFVITIPKTNPNARANVRLQQKRKRRCCD